MGRKENDPEGLIGELRAAGVSEEQIDDYMLAREQVEEAHFLLWEENLPALNFFLAVVGSWIRVGMNGHPVGLSEQAIYTRMSVMGRCRDLELYDDLIEMGYAAAEELTERFY